MHKIADDCRKVLGVALGGIWIGHSNDEVCGNLENIGAILNVAQDMRSTREWPLFETMHVGLIDGPGNEPTAYCAAVLALHALRKRHNVLVCCHTGSRSLAVVLMYLCSSGGSSWENRLIALQERLTTELPAIFPIHKDAYETVDKILSDTRWSET